MNNCVSTESSFTHILYIYIYIRIRICIISDACKPTPYICRVYNTAIHCESSKGTRKVCARKHRLCMTDRRILFKCKILDQCCCSCFFFNLNFFLQTFRKLNDRDVGRMSAYVYFESGASISLSDKRNRSRNRTFIHKISVRER